MGKNLNRPRNWFVIIPFFVPELDVGACWSRTYNITAPDAAKAKQIAWARFHEEHFDPEFGENTLPSGEFMLLVPPLAFEIPRDILVMVQKTSEDIRRARSGFPPADGPSSGSPAHPESPQEEGKIGAPAGEEPKVVPIRPAKPPGDHERGPEE